MTGAALIFGLYIAGCIAGIVVAVYVVARIRRKNAPLQGWSGPYPDPRTDARRDR